MIVYAESSAVLAWLLDEARGAAVLELLAGAERVVASTLTPLECGRTLARGVALGELPPAQAGEAERLLDRTVRGWVLLELTGAPIERARAPFPSEPVRTLDALHLATALAFQETLGPLTVLSLDERIRVNGGLLGLTPGPPL